MQFPKPLKSRYTIGYGVPRERQLNESGVPAARVPSYPDSDVPRKRQLNESGVLADRVPSHQDSEQAKVPGTLIKRLLATACRNTSASEFSSEDQHPRRVRRHLEVEQNLVKNTDHSPTLSARPGMMNDTFRAFRATPRGSACHLMKPLTIGNDIGKASCEENEEDYKSEAVEKTSNSVVDLLSPSLSPCDEEDKSDSGLEAKLLDVSSDAESAPDSLRDDEMGSDVEEQSHFRERSNLVPRQPVAPPPQSEPTMEEIYRGTEISNVWFE